MCKSDHTSSDACAHFVFGSNRDTHQDVVSSAALKNNNSCLVMRREERDEGPGTRERARRKRERAKEQEQGEGLLTVTRPSAFQKRSCSRAGC